MPPIVRNAPYPAHNFQVIINGVSDGTTVSGAFAEVSGLDVEIEKIAYRAGTDDLTVRQLPGLRKHVALKCKRGATGHTEFWQWFKEGLEGRVRLAEGAIVLKDENQVEVMRWNFSRAWPTKYSGPTFDAATNKIAFESVEICVEELSLDL